jgi:hypothetical protein
MAGFIGDSLRIVGVSLLWEFYSARGGWESFSSESGSILLRNTKTLLSIRVGNDLKNLDPHPLLPTINKGRAIVVVVPRPSVS